MSQLFFFFLLVKMACLISKLHSLNVVTQLHVSLSDAAVASQTDAPAGSQIVSRIWCIPENAMQIPPTLMRIAPKDRGKKEAFFPAFLQHPGKHSDWRKERDKKLRVFFVVVHVVHSAMTEKQDVSSKLYVVFFSLKFMLCVPFLCYTEGARSNTDLCNIFVCHIL